MAFRDYSTTPASNTALGDGTYIGPNMLRNKVRPALQQIAADGKALADEVGVVVPAAAAAAQAVIDATPFTVTSATGQSVTTLAMLAGIAAPVNGQVAHLTETGLAGSFIFSTTDLSAFVTADPYQGVYVAPTAAATGASGAWVRIIQDSTYRLSWFGISAATAATSHTRWDSLENLIELRGDTRAKRFGVAGVVLTGFGVGIAASTSAVTLRVPGEIDGQGMTLDPNHTFGSQTGALIGIHASDIDFHHMKFTRCQNDGVNADSFECINIGSRHTGGATEGILTDRISLHDLSFDECDSPIRAIRSTWSGPTNFVPTHLHIHNIHMTNVGYQAIVPWCDEVNIHDFYIQMKSGEVIRPFHTPFRVLGCRKVRITNGRIQDDTGLAAFKLMRAGVDTSGSAYGASYGDAEDVYISNIHMTGIGAAFEFLETSGNIIVDNCSYRGDPTATGAGPHFQFGAHIAPMRNSTIQVRGGIYTGTGLAIQVSESNYKRIVFQNVVFVGNNAAASGASAPVTINNGTTGLLDGAGGQVEGVEMLELDACRFLYKDALFTFGVYITSGKAGQWWSARNCVFPNGVGGAADIALGSGSGTTDGNSTNRIYPAGIWAAQVADFATNPRTGEF